MIWLRWYLRQFFRNVMKPVKPEDARKWHGRLTILYILLAWNAAGYAFYKFRSEKPEDLDKEALKAKHYARIIHTPQATIYRFGNGPMEVIEFDKEAYLRDQMEKEKARKRREAAQRALEAARDKEQLENVQNFGKVESGLDFDNNASLEIPDGFEQVAKEKTMF